MLREYAAYYNGSRCHLSLDRNAPEPRDVESGPGAVRAVVPPYDKVVAEALKSRE